MDSETTINHEEVEDVEDVGNKVEFVETTEEETPNMFSSPWHFSDVVLVVEGTKFHVHKCILSIWSPVFEKMFTSEFAEKNAEEIPLPEKRKMEMEELLKVIYSADPKQEITESNYEFLLKLAREYQMDKVQQHCRWYMGQNIGDQNCLYRYRIADHFGLEDVIEKCNEKALFKSSTELEKSNDFLELGFESKFRLCMARLKELEKALGEYVRICSNLVTGYYKDISDQINDNMGKCDNRISHKLYPYKDRAFDSSCWSCRNTIGLFNCKGQIRGLSVNAIKFDSHLFHLYDLEHNEVAKIIANMKHMKGHQEVLVGKRETLCQPDQARWELERARSRFS